MLMVRRSVHSRLAAVAVGLGLAAFSLQAQATLRYEGAERPQLGISGEGAAAAGSHRYSFNGFALPAGAFPLDVVVVGPWPSSLSRGEISTAVEQAAAQWTGVPCSFAALRFAGFRESLASVGPKEVPILFNTPEDVLALDSRLVAVTAFGWPRVGARGLQLNAVDYAWSPAAEPFRRLEPGYAAASSPVADLEKRPVVDLAGVLTHEFGHVLGLGHTEEDRAATMVAAYLSDGGQATLAGDDKLAVCALYPAAGRECEADGDCPSAGQCIQSGGVAVCEEYRAPRGAYCAVDALHCREGCVLEDLATGTGYCATTCAVDAQCDTGMTCGRYRGRSVCVWDTMTWANEALPGSGCRQAQGSLPVDGGPGALGLLAIVGMGVFGARGLARRLSVRPRRQRSE